MFPAWLRDYGLGLDSDGKQRRPNLSPAAHSYLERLGLDVEDLFHHVLAVLHDPEYREANAGALRMEWPRIPLPGWPDGSGDDAAAELAASAARGWKLAALLDPDTPVPGVTEPRPGVPSGSALCPEIAEIAVPSTIDDTNMTGDDFALTAGWGHLGQGEAVMPGQGRAIERPHTAPEQAALPSVVPALSRNPVPVPRNTRDDAHTPGDTTTPRTEDDAALPPVIPALSRNPVPVPRDTGDDAHTPGDTTTPRTEDDAALPPVIPALSRNPVPVPRDTGDDAHTPGDTTTPRTEDDAALPPVIPALSRNPVPVPRDTRDDAHTPGDTTTPRTEDDAALPPVIPALSRNPVPTPSDAQTLDDTSPVLGDTTFDIYLNDRAYWRNVPAPVWNYKLGGYQVLKKWLSYRDHKVLARPLHPQEVQHFTNTARRITAILQLVTRS